MRPRWPANESRLRLGLSSTSHQGIRLIQSGIDSLIQVKRLLRRRSFLVNGTLAVLLAVGIGVGYLSLTSGGDSAGASLTRTARVTRGTLTSSVSASGSVGSAKTEELSFATSGTVSEINVEAGNKVKKGAVLAKLDQTTAKETVDSARANLTAAEDGDISTASGYSTYISARNAYNQAKRELDGTELTAPFTGTVVTVNGTVGGSSNGSGSTTPSSSSSTSPQSQSSTGSTGNNSTSNGSTGNGFIELADTAKLNVTGEFTEADAVKLKTGQAATVTFDALSGVTATGKVTQIDMSPTTNNNVVQYGATIGLTEPPASIRLGQTATVKVATATRRNVLYVPTAAVRTAGGRSTVTVLQGGSQAVRFVQTGIKGDAGTEITSGLGEGDQVVIATQNGGGTNGIPGPGLGGGLGGGRVPGGPGGLGRGGGQP